MSEEPTKDLSGRSFEEQVLYALGDIRMAITGLDLRLTSVEQRLTSVEQRLTSVEQRLTSVEQRLTSLEERQAIIEDRFSKVEERLTALDDKVDARLMETRPIWQSVLTKLEHLDEKFDQVIRDLYDVRADVGLHDKRLKEIERRLNS